MKLLLLIAAVCIFIIAAILGLVGDSVSAKDIFVVTDIGLAAFAASFLPV